MRILIDFQSTQTDGSKNRGVGRYTIEMVRALSKISKKNDEIFVLLNGYFINECFDVKNKIREFIDEKHIIVWNWYPDIKPACKDNGKTAYFGSLFFQNIINKLNPDVVWSPNFQEGLTEPGVAPFIQKKYFPSTIICSTLHDVSPLIEPLLMPPNFIMKWYKKVLQLTADSDLIFTVSNFSKLKIQEILNVSGKKIVVASSGVNRNFYDGNKKKKFIFYTGGFEKYKNISCLIEAYSLLPLFVKNKYKLVIAGKGCHAHLDEIKTKLKSNKISKSHYILKDYISDKKLINYYQQSAFFIFPSYAEGLGLPPIEAIACGAVSLVSNKTSLPETVGTEMATFDPQCPKELCNLIVKYCSNKKKMGELFKLEKNNIKKFNWDKSALIIYKSFLNLYLSSKIYKKKNLNIENILFKSVKKFSKNKKYISLVAKSMADYTPIYKKTSIYFDVGSCVYLKYLTGIQRVCFSLSKSLMNKFLGVENVKFTPIYYDYKVESFIKCKVNNGNLSSIHRINSSDIVQFNSGDVLILADLDMEKTIRRINYFKSLILRGIKIYSIIYDLIPIYYKKYTFSKAFADAYKIYLKTIFNFSGIITISKTVLCDLKRWKKENGILTNENFIETYFYLGNDLSINVSLDASDKEIDFFCKEKKLTFLMVSTIEPRKMHLQVLEAFNKLWSYGTDVRLIFVGRKGWNVDDFCEYMLSCQKKNKNFIWISNATDSLLHKIYNISDCVIVASVVEGFGLPIIEAAKYRKHLILRDIPIFREIASRNAFYFKTFDADELAHFILRWINLYNCGKAPTTKNIKMITWAESADIFSKKLNLKSK